MYKVIIAGATGMVGRNILKTLENRNFPIKELKLLASKRSVGKLIKFKDQEIAVEELKEDAFQGYDFAFFAAGGSISEVFVPHAIKAGVRCIDNSSHFRMNPEVPLIVPEINGHLISDKDYLIANPNCSTIQCMAPLYQLKKYGIKRVVYSTYQAVSGSGKDGLEDLENHTHNFYPYPIHQNIIPHIDDFLDSGYTKEEMKMINETRKILDLDNLPVTATTVRVPVKFGHAVSINVELEKDFDLDDVKASMNSEELGLELMDQPEKLIYPMPLLTEGKDMIFVGRIRRDESLPFGLNLWSVSDNTVKGAALNAVQNAELFIKEGIL